MRISSLPLPPNVISLFESQGYKELYPPQIEAIKSGVLNGANLLITSPTASGKTLIALMAAAKIVINNEGKVVYLAPLRALANEKFEEFNTLSTLQKSNGERVKVLISTGDYDSRSEYLSEGDILILTNEKFDSILRHGADWLNFVKLFVIDEIHLVDSPDRGPTIETIIAKILTYASQSQLLALSATITNAKELADWLGAKLVNINWRPVKLIEGVYEYGKIKFIDGSIREIKPTGKGAVIDVAIDTISENGQSLIFVETRKRAMSLSLKSAEITKHFLTKDEIDKLKNLSEEILNTGEETELSRTLAKVVSNGVAFHHAGLDAQHRRIVESGFRDGLIKLLIATPTLAAGVNLPARRVVISSFMRYDSEYGGQMPISILEYKQMCLPYNTRILMGDGSTLPIGEIVKKRICGNVITYDERLKRFVQKRIVNWFSRDATQLVEIRTNNGRKLLLTPEHPIMTKNSWVPAGDLKNNDKIAYVKEFEYEVNKSLLYFFKYLPLNGTYLKNRVDLFELIKAKYKQRELADRLGVDLKSIKEYAEGRKAIPLRIILKICDLLSLNDDEIAERLRIVKTAYGTPMNIPKYIDEDFMWILGLVVTNGYIQKIKDKRSGSFYYKVRVFNKNKNVIEKATRIFCKLGFKPYVYEKNGYVSLEVGSTLLAKVMNKFGIPFGRKIHVKVGDVIFSFPPNLINAYLIGVFDGDGDYSESKLRSSVRKVLIPTVSRKFAYGLHDLLLRLGIVSSIKVNQPKITVIASKKAEFKRPVYNIIFRKLSDIEKFTKYLTPVKYKISTINYNRYHNLSDYYLKSESVEWLCVKSVRRLNGKYKVYNISIEGTENYVAENYVVHNCGRAGRPQYDSIGETVLIAHSSSEADEIIHHYIKGTPEPIQSRLSQGGALRTHTLATVSTLPGIDDIEIFELFSKTLFSKQYRKVTFHKKIKEAIEYLIDNKLIERKAKRYIATEFGKRISLLYIDPETGVMFRDALRFVKDKTHPIGLLHLIVISQDFTPKFPLRSKDWELAISFVNEFKDKFIIPIPNERDYNEYESFLSNMRSLMVMLGWIDEWSEDKLLTTYGVEPGDLHRAVESADWLLYSLSEISKLLGYTNLLNEIYELRQRVKYGIKPELIPLVSLEGIGRIRARSLYNFGFTSLEKLASASIDKIASVPKIGYTLAKRIKDQIELVREK
ncbi:MAG: DEAD/DEAH box helicase [Nitrososphaerales archaeon]